MPFGRGHQQIQLLGGQGPVHHPGAPLLERHLVAGEDPLRGVPSGRLFLPSHQGLEPGDTRGATVAAGEQVVRRGQCP